MIANHAKPRNGQYFVGLLDGGNEDVMRTLAADLFEEYGVAIEKQWTTVRQIDRLPIHCEVALILTDFCAHEMSRQTVKLCKASNVRYALIGRKQSAWLNGMQVSGFVRRPSWLKPRAPQGPKKEIVMMPDSTPAPAPVTTTVAAKFEALPPAKRDEETKAKPVDTLARYVPQATSKQGWPEDQAQQMIAIAEKWKGDAQSFVSEVHRVTGVYRTPRALGLRLRSLGSMVTLPDGFLTGLERMGKKIQTAKIEALRAEKSKSLESLEWVSWKRALECVGGVSSRLRDVRPYYDRILGLRVVRRDDLQRVLNAYTLRGQDPRDRTAVTGYTALEWERKILEALKAGPQPGSPLHQHSKQGALSLNELVTRGLIETTKIHGNTFYRLPGKGHEWPKRNYYIPPKQVVPPQFVPAPAPLVVNVANGVKHAEPKRVIEPATQDELTAARADIYRAMRAGEISARDAAELLRNLAR